LQGQNEWDRELAKQRAADLRWLDDGDCKRNARLFICKTAIETVENYCNTVVK
jgi:hypothetical protein